MADEIKVNITATDDASKKLDKVADAAEKLEKLSPEIEVDADTKKAERDIESLSDAAKELDARDIEIALELQASDLRRELAAVEGQIDSVRGSADRAEKSVRDFGGAPSTGAVADIGGLFGQAEGAASTFGGAVEGVTDLLVGLGPALGLSAKAAQSLAVALPVVGIAVAAGAGLWSVFSGNQKKAREEGEKLLKIQQDLNKALAEGKADEAAEKFVEGYEPAIKAAEKLGLSVAGVTKYVTGQADSIDGLNSIMDNADAVTLKLIKDVEEQRKAYINANGELDEAASTTDTVKDAISGLTDVTIENKEATEKATAAANDWLDARLAAVDANFAARDSEEDFQTAIEDSGEAMTNAFLAQLAYNDAVKKHGANSLLALEAADKLKDAQEGLTTSTKAERDAALDTAEAHVRLAEETATAAGKTVTAEEKIDALNESLLESARHATPAARDEIIRYIAEVNGIPLEKATAVVANADTEQARRDLDSFVDADRSVVIPVHIDLPTNAETNLDEFFAQFEGNYQRKRNFGGDDVVTRPTLFMAGENYHPERVRITPGLGGSSDPGITGSTVTNNNVTVNMPRGTRPGDMLRQTKNYARRNGVAAMVRRT